MANRFFYAVPLPDSIHAGIVAAQNVLRASIGGALRLVQPDNLHITVQFVGNRPSGDPLVSLLSHPLGGPFEVDVDGFGFFPSPRRPRVCWVGVKDATGGLSRLHDEVGRRLQERGVTVERRAYSPHITVGYIRKRVTTREAMNVVATVGSIQNGGFGSFEVDRVLLLNSRPAPGGSVYTVLEEAVLSTH